MTVGELMSHPVWSIAPEESIASAARLMRMHDVGLLPVLHGERVLGVISDRDLVVRCLAEGADSRRTHVGQVMTPGVYFCFEDEPLSAASESMEEYGVRRLVVFDRKMRLKGLVSLDDLAAAPEGAAVAAETAQHLST